MASFPSSPYDLWQERDRAHSYGEESNRKVYNMQSLPSVSSGYSSFANSTQSSLAHVEMEGQSQESLTGLSNSAIAHSGRANRGGSLKAYAHYSTQVHANHAKLKHSHKSLD